MEMLGKLLINGRLNLPIIEIGNLRDGKDTLLAA